MAIEESEGDNMGIQYFPVYVREIKKAHRRRILEEKKIEILQSVEEGDMEKARMLMDMVKILDPEDMWSSVMDGYIDRFDERTGEISKGRSGEIKTGLYDLDVKTGGLGKNQLWVIGSVPGHGKTTLGLQMAIHVARQGKSVGFFSLEMTKEQLADRFACGQAGVEYSDFITCAISQKDNLKVTNIIHKLRDLDISVYKKALATSDDLIMASRLRHFDLIVIDYLQRVRATNARASLNEKATEIAQTAKAIAKLQENTVVLLSQLNRAPGHRDDGKPSMHDLRDSGMIESEGDLVMLLWRPSVYDKERNPQEGYFVIPKMRFGESCELRMVWAGAKGWQNYEWRGRDYNGKGGEE